MSPQSGAGRTPTKKEEPPARNQDYNVEEGEFMGSKKITEDTTTTAPAGHPRTGEEDWPDYLHSKGSFQQDQQGNHERQNQAYAEK